MLLHRLSCSLLKEQSWLSLFHSLTLSPHCLDLSSCVLDPFPTAFITNWHSLHKDLLLSFMINASLWLPGSHCCCGRLWSCTFSSLCVCSPFLQPLKWSASLFAESRWLLEKHTVYLMCEGTNGAVMYFFHIPELFGKLILCGHLTDKRN